MALFMDYSPYAKLSAESLSLLYSEMNMSIQIPFSLFMSLAVTAAQIAESFPLASTAVPHA